MKTETAYWNTKTHMFKGDEHICSACGYVSKKRTGKCPGCGRKMRKGKKDLGWIDGMEAFDAIFGD